MTPNIIEYGTPLIQGQSLAREVARQLTQAIDKKGRATLAVPGGTTPNAFLSALSHEHINWSKVAVTLTDERWVPIDNVRSNFALLCRTLKQNNAALAEFIPLYHAVPSPEEALTPLAETLTPHLPLDVCVVGMGEDMHTASLFPKANGLTRAISDNADHILAPIRPHDTDEIRITLTATVFNAALHHHVLITGKSKLRALKMAEKTPSTSDAPIRLILKHSSTLIHYAA